MGYKKREVGRTAGEGEDREVVKKEKGRGMEYRGEDGGRKR